MQETVFEGVASSVRCSRAGADGLETGDRQEAGRDRCLIGPDASFQRSSGEIGGRVREVIDRVDRVVDLMSRKPARPPKVVVLRLASASSRRPPDRGDRRRDVVHGVTLSNPTPRVDLARDIAASHSGCFTSPFAKIKIAPGS